MYAHSRVLIIFISINLSGCTDILPWPGFAGRIGQASYPEQIPANKVVRQVRCELSQFIEQDAKPGNSNKQLLDPKKGAQVQLKLTTDLQGYVNYTGINLKGLGLGALAQLVTTTNKVPSLQLKAQGKSTVTSQLDFVIPQTNNPLTPITIPDNSKGANPGVTKTAYMSAPLLLLMPKTVFLMMTSSKLRSTLGSGCG